MAKKMSIVCAIVSLVLLVVISCSESVSSKPNYIFKTAPKHGVAAKFMGEEISMEELHKGIESEIYAAQKRIFNIKMNKLRSYILDKLIAAHPKKKNLSNDQFIDQVIAKGLTVSPKEINAFIAERKVPKNHINDNFKKRLKKYLKRQKKSKALEHWIAKQTAKKPVEVYLVEPQAPVFDIPTEGVPFSGPADGKVTLVEFSDFQCPHCRKGAEVIGKLKDKYKGKLKVVFKNFPLKMHNHAQIAAEASLCAQDQKAFWKMHDKMFADAANLDKESLKKKAREIGLDGKKFDECLDSEVNKKRVMADIEDGKSVGVRSTPAFFINGKKVGRGSRTVEFFADLIDKELGK